MPTSVVATGGILVRHDGRQVPDTIDALFEYPEGFHVNMASTFNAESVTGNGIHFLGTDGTLVLPLGGTSMTYGIDSHREGYKYSIDSWPVALQEEFMNVGNRREEAARKALHSRRFRPRIVLTQPLCTWRSSSNVCARGNSAAKMPKSGTVRLRPGTW